MSNFLAIATVSAAIERLLQASVEVDVAGAKVTLDRPDTKTTGPVVNVFLYQVAPNPVRTNDDLPGRRPDGSVAQRPRAAVDLSYLLTFHGSDLELEPQRLFGSVVRTLTARPIITTALVDAVVAAAGGSPAKHPSLADSDLADADDLVRLAPRAMDLEQMSRLWAAFPQTAYVLSSSWSASVVMVDSTETPVRSAPVVQSRLTVEPLRRPTIMSVELAADPLAPLTAGSTWRIRGTQLVGNRTVVRVAGQELTPSSATPVELLVDVSPPSALRAGRVAVEVVHQALLGDPPTPHGDLASDVRTVSLCPQVLTSSATSNAVSLTTDIPVRAGQSLAVRLAVPASGAVVSVVPLDPPTQDTSSVTAPISVAAGSYAVILAVDAADSPVQRSQAGTITSPVVTVP